LLSLAALLLACSSEPAADDTAATAPVEGFDPPVATNAEPPFNYPPDLYEEGVEGSVVLRLYVDASGQVVPDSTSIAEGSDYPAFDSAAVAGASALAFAPAVRDGRPVPTVFLQPVHFRMPNRPASGGGS
jgi:TonB family protein